MNIVELGFCACGCGQKLTTSKTYIHGHNWRGKLRKPKKEAAYTDCSCGCGKQILIYSSAQKPIYAVGHNSRHAQARLNQQVEGFCDCGCGTKMIKFDTKNRARKFLAGHATRLREYPEGHFDYMIGNQRGFKKNQTPWNKGQHPEYLQGSNNPYYGKRHSPDVILKMTGENNGNWKGGVSVENDVFRRSWPYRKWRKAVLDRDSHQCVLCGSKVRLHADHIKPFALFPELRTDINNGRTLCEECHKKTETYGAHRNNMPALTS